MNKNSRNQEEDLVLCLEINRTFSDSEIKRSFQSIGITGNFKREDISPFDVPSPGLPKTAAGWEKSLEAQESWFHKFLEQLNTYKTEPKIHLFLSAPLPLCFALGIRLSNRVNCIVYQEDQENRISKPMNISSEESSLSTEPYWDIEGISHEQAPDTRSGPVILGISISHDVSIHANMEIPELGIPEPVGKIYLKPRKEIGHNAIQSSEHHKALSEFKRLIDRIIYLWPNRTGIHLFYAGPASMAFLLGQRINMNIHYPISFYNFRGNNYHVFDSPFSDSPSGFGTFKPRSLPVISLVVSGYRKEREDIFQGYHVLMILHLLSDFASMIEEFEKIGLDSSKTKIIGIPYSAKDHVRKWLQGNSFDVIVSDCDSYFDIYNQVEKALEEQLQICKKENEKLLIIEDGGYAVPILHSKFKEYIPYVVGAVEQTANGIWTDRELEKKGKLRIPVMNVAECEYKKEVESILVGQAIVTNIKDLLSKIGKGLDKKALVVGFGATGRMVAQELQNAGASVTVSDLDKYRLHLARISSYNVCENPRDGISDKELIVGCTGKTWLTDREMSQLKHGAYIINATSKKKEINYDDLDAICQGRSRMDKSIGFTYKIGSDGREIHLLADGFPINFFENESIPDEQIQFIPALMTASAIELLQNKYEPGIHDVPKELQNKIASYQLDHS